MNPLYQITLKLIQIKLDVKFAAVMSLQFQGTTIAQSNRYENGAFHFDSQFRIQLYQKYTIPFWQCCVVLKTHRGARYNSGILRLRYSEIINLHSNLKVQIPLAKCYDSEAWAQLTLIELSKPNLNSRSQPHFFTLIHQNRSNSQNILSNKIEAQNPTNSNIQTRKLSIVEEIQSGFFKQKMQELQKIISDKSLQIRQLQVLNARNLEQLNKSRAQITQLQISSRQKLTNCQQSLIDIQNQLDSAHKFIAQKQEEDEEREQQHWAQLNRIREEYETKVLEDIEKFKEELCFLSEQNNLQKEQIQKKQIIIRQNQKFLTEKEEQNKSLLGLNLQLKQQIRQLREKLKEWDSYKLMSLQQKDQIYLKYKQAKKEVEEARTIKKSVRILQDELCILKKNADKTVRYKDSVVDKISQESKYIIENLQAELIRVTEASKKNQAECRELSEQQNKLKQKITHLETLKQQTSSQLAYASQKLTVYADELKKCKQKVIFLQGCQVEHTNRERILQLQVENLKNQNEMLNSKLKQQNQKNQQLDEQLQSMQFQVQKHSVQSALYLTRSENVHVSCVFKQEQLRQALATKETMLDDVTNQNTELKSRNKESQRLLHQLRLEEAKNRELIARNSKNLQSLQRQIAKLQKETRQKQLQIVSLAADKEKTNQICKELSSKIETLTLENFYLQEKGIKNSTIIDQLSTENQQMKSELKIKMAIIEKHEHGELELRKVMNNEKQKAAKAQNQTRVVKREFERYINKIHTQVQHVVKLDQNANPIQSIISHFKTCMSKLESQITSIMAELEQIKSSTCQKDKAIEELSLELQLKDVEVIRKQQVIQLIKQGLDQKQEQLACINQEHNQLLSIHEQYIFTFNRYKIDKEEELKLMQTSLVQLSSRLEDFQALVEKQDKDLISKTNQIQNLRQLALSNEAKAKNLIKQREKLSSHVSEQTQKSESQSQKLAKMSKELNTELQKNQKMTIENEMLLQKIEQIKSQLASSKQMTEMMSRAKQKTSIQLMTQTEKLLILELQHSALRESYANLEQQKQACLKTIDSLKQNIKALKSKNKEQEQQLSLVQSLKIKLYDSNQQKTLTIKQLQVSISNLEASLQKHQLGRQNQLRELSQRYQNMEREYSKLMFENKQLMKELSNKQYETSEQIRQHQQQQIRLQNEIQHVLTKISKYDEKMAYHEKKKEEQEQRIKQMERKIVELEEELCQKQIQIYTITGKLSEIQIKWQGQQKKHKQDSLRYAEYLQEQGGAFEQKMQQLRMENQKLIQERNMISNNLAIKEQALQSTKKKIVELEQQSNKKSVVYEGQLSNLNITIQDKLHRYQQQLIEKESAISKCAKQKSQMEQAICILKNELMNKTQKCGNLSTEAILQKERINRLETIVEENRKKQHQDKVLRLNERIGMAQDISRQFQIFKKSRSQEANPSKQDQLQQKILKIIELPED